jgi:hypothetical protein
VFLFVLAGEDLGDAVAARGGVECEAGAGQRHEGPLGQAEIAALDIGVLNHQLRDHFGDHVVEVGSMSDEPTSGSYFCRSFCQS